MCKLTGICLEGISVLRRRVTTQSLRLAICLLICYWTAGCVAPKRASFVIPKRCIGISAQSFTRPCSQRLDGKLVCDGVVITAKCFEAPR
jgi:hypothetical protein